MLKPGYITGTDKLQSQVYSGLKLARLVKITFKTISVARISALACRLERPLFLLNMKRCSQ